MNGITQHARSSELESFGTSVTSSQTALCAMTEAAAQVGFYEHIIFLNLTSEPAVRSTK